MPLNKPMTQNKHSYETPLCEALALRHRELIASSLVTLITIDTAPDPVSIEIEDISYEAF